MQRIKPHQIDATGTLPQGSPQHLYVGSDVSGGKQFQGLIGEQTTAPGLVRAGGGRFPDKWLNRVGASSS